MSELRQDLDMDFLMRSLLANSSEYSVVADTISRRVQVTVHVGVFAAVMDTLIGNVIDEVLPR